MKQTKFTISETEDQKTENKIQNNIIWTNQPTKIIVDAPVYYSVPKQITNAEILSKAANVLPQYSKLINNAYSEENVR